MLNFYHSSFLNSHLLQFFMFGKLIHHSLSKFLKYNLFTYSIFYSSSFYLALYSLAILSASCNYFFTFNLFKYSVTFFLLHRFIFSFHFTQTELCKVRFSYFQILRFPFFFSPLPRIIA
jgi:hypothetical protein